MKNIFLILILPLFSIYVSVTSCNQNNTEEFMSVTTSSEEAMKLYQKAYETAYGVVELDKAVFLYEQAIKEDPNFFMAYYQLATYYLFHNKDKEFAQNASAGIQCNIELSEGEQIQKKALEEWIKNKNSNNSKFGLRLVELYPNDPDAYINLGFFYYTMKDYTNAISAFKKAIITENPDQKYCGPKLAIVPICMLGYSYLIKGQPDSAGTCFDNYIQQYPNEQNPYDCKADYFITIKEYDKAYEYYMKAFEIDTSFQVFRQRANYVKQIYDSIQNK